MGFLDSFDGVSVGPAGMSRPSRRHKKHRSRSRSGSRHRSSRSIAGSLFGGGDSHYHKHNSSKGSFFGLGNSSSHYHKNNASRGSFFGLGNSSRSSFFGLNRSSYYKRSPRSGFISRTYKHLKRLIRDLIHYAKRHPFKVFFLVIMPLVTTGALTALLARFGLRMPPTLERMLGVASRAASGDHIGLVSDAVRMAGGDFGGSSGASRVSVERGRDGGMQWERRSGYAQKDDGWGDGIMNGVAKMFL